MINQLNIKNKFLLFSSLMMASLLVTACGSLPEGINVPESEALRFLERKSGLIAYMGTDGNIYTIDQAGGNLQAVTTDADLRGENGLSLTYQIRGWSPDSEKIAFIGFNARQNYVDYGALYTANPDGSEMVEHYRSSEDVPLFANWAPNGSKLGVLTATPNYENYKLLSIPLTGERGRQVIGEGPPFYWTWEPEGDRVLAHIGRASIDNPDSRISIIDTQTASERDFGLKPSYFGTPAWSPDGFQMLAAVEDPRTAENTLTILGLQGTIRDRITTFENGITFGWSPDSTHIAYIESSNILRGPMGPMTIVNATNTQEKVQMEDDLVLGYFWSPDSKRIAYIAARIIPRGEGEGIQDLDIFYTLSVYDIKKKSSVEISTFFPTPTFASVLNSFDQYQHSMNIWSPDGENIVLTGISFEDNQTPGVFIIASSGNINPRFISEGILAFWSWK